MKYQLGDRVKYDDGEWLLYGTVSAVYEHSSCPFYRVNVERKEKKNSKYSIVQFEFELEADSVVADSEKEKREWVHTEIEYLGKYYGVHNIEDMAKVLRRTIKEIEEKWRLIQLEKDPEQIKKQESEPEPKVRRKRKQELKQEAEPEPEKVELTQKPKEETPKKTRGKRGEAWSRNLEMYQKGEKSNAISTWMAQNRREYKSGKLAEGKLDKLLAISFPFETIKKKNDSWDNRLEEWKKGERRSVLMQQWRQRSVKQYTEGKLTTDRIAKLKEVGILK